MKSALYFDRLLGSVCRIWQRVEYSFSPNCPRLAYRLFSQSSTHSILGAGRIHEGPAVDRYFAPYLLQVFDKLWQTTCSKPPPQGSHGLELQTEPSPLSLVTVAQFQSVVSRCNIVVLFSWSDEETRCPKSISKWRKWIQHQRRQCNWDCARFSSRTNWMTHALTF